MRSRLVVCRFCPGFIGIKFANLFSKPLSNIFDPESLDMATGYIKSTIDWSFATQQKVSTPDDFKNVKATIGKKEVISSPFHTASAVSQPSATDAKHDYSRAHSPPSHVTYCVT